MKTEIMYATTCNATIYFSENTDLRSGEWKDSFKSLSEAISTADFILYDIYPQTAEKVVIWDSNTGEVLAECSRDDDDNFEDKEPDCDWDYNEDMGFDPYMGCYSDDC